MDEMMAKAVEVQDLIKKVEGQLKTLRALRRQRIIELRANKITARLISDTLGLSEQNIHKIVKGKSD